MKLMSLNGWGCRVTDPIYDFIKKHSESIDIFCFQEILKGGKGKTDRGEIKSGYEDIKNLLPNYSGYFMEYGEGGYYGESQRDLDFRYGIACFASKKLKQSVGQGIDLIDSARKWSDYDGRFAVGVALPIVVEGIVIINVHGLWQNSIKTDTEAKIEQSKKIIALAEGIEGNKVICGDFNLLPDTEAIKMLGEKYRDLIREYSVKNTRSSFYPKEIRYSDYVFADKNLVIKNFEVSDINISDHLPMVLELI